jgi:hypothetical protein
LNPKHLVCKFAIPFFREILYQRMLIEQKTDIHMMVARSLQISKSKYMSHDKEVKCLEMHLKIAEKTLMRQMESEDEEQLRLLRIYKNKNTDTLNLNNLKINLVKNICEKLKLIDLKLETETENQNKKSFLSIKAGYIEKKSDKNITWE